MSTPVGRGVGESWRALRVPLLVTGFVVLAAIVVLIATSARTSGQFSPDSTESTGARALAALLEDHNVDVHGTESLNDAVQAGGGSALLIGPGGSLDDGDWRRIAQAQWSHVILIRPSSRALEALAPGVRPTGTSLASRSRQPGCELPAAVKAGTVTVNGPTYFAPQGATTCYGDGINNTVVRLEVGDRLVDVIGTPGSFMNARLAEDGNAALALNLLGTHQDLTWYLPQWESDYPDSSGESSAQLIPPDVRYIAWALAFAVLVIAIWRGRRLGPVVAEQLPVIVHAAETTEGRARLYRRSRARDRAASALRESALGQLHEAHGIPRRADPSAVVATVAARTGRDPAMLYELLYGMPPLTDAALMSLSQELDVLTQEVRHP
ncbi:hypothetical protein EV651_12480 [Kribbella sp. VKM Ac-2571]|uniref:DUF4350 domain-containing protein n=1 Tax=Kribbella sp. VKM Ac-2571 TaxID=2512222 RepID=UPI00105B2613|nr:DUF4350 domain-containing protein [Kribbella sp. VKM Ac-2571]TDO47641.1 hypothetical protein EV651_12480 [Kribbella sp. VKM Ac-2571]